MKIYHNGSQRENKYDINSNENVWFWKALEKILIFL